ncbi:MAG: division inhibitor protein [Methanomassiliicoccales archaeon PtaU1.Bin124]|nr:MAG: division inhibitor protein [Methanomassiliicoccales archaeon PtaU1.Bin124]
MAQRKKSGERQKEIILAAVKIIDKDGIHALTLQSIANELGISDVALLRHFRSKEEIVEALAQKVFFTTVITEDPSTNHDLEASIESLFRRQFSEFEAWPEATSIFFHEEIFREYPSVREWFLVRRTERHRRLVRMVKAGQTAGKVRNDLDADIFATVLMGSMRMAVMEWRESGRNGSLVEKAAPMADMMARAIEIKNGRLENESN